MRRSKVGVSGRDSRAERVFWGEKERYCDKGGPVG